MEVLVVDSCHCVVQIVEVLVFTSFHETVPLLGRMLWDEVLTLGSNGSRK